MHRFFTASDRLRRNGWIAFFCLIPLELAVIFNHSCRYYFGKHAFKAVFYFLPLYFSLVILIVGLLVLANPKPIRWGARVIVAFYAAAGIYAAVTPTNLPVYLQQIRWNLCVSVAHLERKTLAGGSTGPLDRRANHE